MPGTKLAGLRILVTRPADQAAPLLAAIQQAGGQVLAFPTLDIQPCTDPQSVLRQLGSAGTFDWAIFVSANAVRHGVPLLQQSGIDLTGMKLAAAGNATAGALGKAGLGEIRTPQQAFNSEALAALPEFENVSGQRILIVRGIGGREWLRDALVTRGAQVEYAEVYQRLCPQADPRPVLAACADGDLHAVTSTSNQGLQNLLSMLPQAECVLQLPLIVVGSRQADAAMQLGWRGSVVAAGDPRAETIVQTLIAQRDNW